MPTSMNFDLILDAEIAIIPTQKPREEVEAEGWRFSSTCNDCGKIYPARTRMDALRWGAEFCDDCRQTNMPW